MPSIANSIQNPDTTVLEVFIAPGCWGCDTATSLAAAIRDREIPGLRIELIDLTCPDNSKPANVFAVPTYRLDGKVISLGNPEESEIVDQLTLHTENHAESTKE